KIKATKEAAVKIKVKKASVAKANAASRCNTFIALHGILRNSNEARESGPFLYFSAQKHLVQTRSPGLLYDPLFNDL
ncbi:MAG: hypothetical protein O7D88_08445, partial [Gammaproteobacteria bacterium]|nr:hypothetical protein [Gammaproteobacteria bacterium]